MFLLLVSHLLGRYMILVIFPAPVELFLIPLPEVVDYIDSKVSGGQSGQRKYPSDHPTPRELV
jgi:hypothetical protein